MAKRIRQLLTENRDKPRKYEIANADGEEATVYLYDVIDSYYGISAERFIKDLSAISAKVIHLRINSPGGDVFEAQAMMTGIKQHPARVIAHIDGLAASAASQIALAADEVEITQGAFYMIHRSWTFAFGNAEDLMDMASLLEKIDDEMVKHYQRETGNTVEQIKSWVDVETWFNAEEAVEHGFADRLAEPAAKASSSWNVSAFLHPPKDLLTPPAPPATEPGPEHADALRGFRTRERRIA